jgi:hypothetical protein
VVTRAALRCTALAALVAAALGAQSPASSAPVAPVPAPSGAEPSAQVRSLARGLALAAMPYLDGARRLVLGSVAEVAKDDPDLSRAVDTVWSTQFAPDQLEGALVAEIGQRLTPAQEAEIAAWNSSPAAMRLSGARALVQPPAPASIDPRALTGDDALRWREAERMVAVCGLFESATALVATVNYRATLAALRVLQMPPEFVESKRKELESALLGKVDESRPALREKALRATFLSSRSAPPADLRAEVDFFASPAGQAKCRAQTESLEKVLLERIDSVPVLVAALRAPRAPAPAP